MPATRLLWRREPAETERSSPESSLAAMGRSLEDYAILIEGVAL